MSSKIKKLLIVVVVVLIVVVAGGTSYLIYDNVLKGKIKGSPKADIQDLKDFAKKYEEGNTAQAEDLGYVKTQEYKKKEYTNDDLKKDVDLAFFGGAKTDEDKQRLQKIPDTILHRLGKKMSELSVAEQEKYKPLLLKPDDSGSYFNPANLKWDKSKMELSYGDQLRDKAYSLLGFFLPSLAAACGPDVDCLTEDDFITIESDFVDNMYVKVPQNVTTGSPDTIDGNNLFLEARGHMAMSALEQAFPKFRDFLGVSASDVSRPIVVWISGDIVDVDDGSIANGIHYACDQIYVDVFGPHLKATTVHELFHCFQDSTGMLDPTYDDWMIEGGAKFSEHVAFPADNSEHEWHDTYLTNPKETLFFKSYEDTIMWLAEAERTSMGYVAQIMKSYMVSKDWPTYSTLLKDNWHQIALDLSNNSTLDSLNKGKAPTDSGQPVDVSASEDSYEKIDLNSFAAHDFMVFLEPMSANYIEVKLGGNVTGDGSYVRFDLGPYVDPNDPDFEMSIAVKASTDAYKKVTPKEDDDGNAYVLVCLKDNEICDQAGESDVYEGATEIFVTMTNSSAYNAHFGSAYVTAFGPPVYTLEEVHFMGGELVTPVKGSLDISIDIDNQNPDERLIRTEAHRFWMEFPHWFYDWDSVPDPEGSQVNVTVHPTHFTAYVNKFCMFRGFVEYEIDGDVSEEELADGWIRRTIPIKEKDKGNFYVTEQKFVCRISEKMVDTLVMEPASAATFALMLARINAAEYPEESFAKALRNVFARMMSFDLRDGKNAETDGDAILDFYSPNPSVEYLRVYYADENIKAYYVKKQ